MDKDISKITSLVTGKAHIFIQLTDYCNFSCKYCIAGGRRFTGIGLKRADLDRIIEFLIKIKKIYNIVEVTVSGGEPSLSTDFFYLINLLLDIDVEIKIKTNAYIFHKKEQEISDMARHKNIGNIFFDITYHYYEYENIINTFIKSILVLNKHNFRYCVNFLLPDNTSLENFLQTKNKIDEEGKLSYYNYTLIISTNGEASENYTGEMLKFFNENERKADRVDRFLLKLQYSDGNESSIWTRNFLHSGLNNKLTGSKCVYISKDFVNIHITHDMSIYFGTCYTLNRLRYDIDEVLDLFNRFEEKSITCGDMSCIGESNFHTTKILKYNSKNDELRDILMKNIKSKKLKDGRLMDVIISENTIQIVFFYKQYYLFYVVEKKNLKIEVRYYFSDDYLGYHFFLRDKSNGNIEIGKEDIVVILSFLKFLFTLNVVFRKIIRN